MNSKGNLIITTSWLFEPSKRFTANVFVNDLADVSKLLLFYNTAIVALNEKLVIN